MSARSAGLWSPPAPLPEMPPVPPFPLAVFSAAVADFWAAAARSLNVPADYLAVPGLAALGIAIGRSRAVELKPGYVEYAALWTVVVAPPGSTKSASLGHASGPLRAVQRRWLDEHAAAMTEFESQDARYEQQMKKWKADGATGKPPTRPNRPALWQMTLDNCTTEAVALVLRDNPRGVCVMKDELGGFLNGMNQYRAGGKGDDRQFWLSAWAYATLKYNRKASHDAGPVVVDNPFVGIAGMLTPATLPHLRGENRHGEATEDGFVDRFLVSFPDPAAAVGETWDVVSDELKGGYEWVFDRLLAEPMARDEDGHAGPHLIRPDDSARRVWERFTAEIAGRKNALDQFDPYRGVLAKLQGYALRLAVVLWATRRACGELGPDAPLDGETLGRACRLVDYFDAHGRRCHGVGWADRTARVAKRLLRWLAAKPSPCLFTRTEAFQQVKDKREVKSSQGLNSPFQVLIDHGYIRPRVVPSTGRPGPVPEVYEVNPLWQHGTGE